MTCAADSLEPPEFPFRTRLTIDIDHYVRSPRVKLLRAYHGLLRAGADEVVVAVSSGGEGYHLEARFRDEMDDEAAERIRRHFGDDAKRTMMDVERAEYGHTSNVFWTEKGDNEGTRQVFESPEDAIRYVEATRKRDYERARALQLYGRKSVQDTVIPRPSNARQCQE